jgi:predicted RNA binding protein YcfA (HicA-like mRNA interferase family)
MSRRLPAVMPREALRALGRAGFFIHHTSGSHHVLKHPGKPHLRVTVPYHNKDLKRRTLASIIDQAGLAADEFRELL